MLSQITKTDSSQHWLLPDGVADVLFVDAQKQEALRDALLFILTAHGYRLVSPPLIEYTDSLLGHADEDLKLQTFKFIDQKTGRLMGLRADVTPQILRIDGQHGKGVNRYCYVEQVVKTLPQGLFGLRTPLQLGAEIFGVQGIEAELSLLDVLTALLDEIGLPVQDLHLDVGHVAIFDRLCQLHQIDSQTAGELMAIYRKKAMPELSALCQTLKPMAKEDFLLLAGLDWCGDGVPTCDDFLGQLSEQSRHDPQIMAAIDEVIRLAAHARSLGLQVGIDITELSGYHYHTGVVFNGYLGVGQSSQALVRGGRFVGVGKQQQARNATGFSMDLNRLLAFVELQEDTVIWVDYEQLQTATTEQKADLAKQIKTLQDEGCVVIKPISPDDRPDEIDGVLEIDDNQTWAVRLVGDDC